MVLQRIIHAAIHYPPTGLAVQLARTNAYGGGKYQASQIDTTAYEFIPTARKQ